jgi:hypothetical protein
VGQLWLDATDRPICVVGGLAALTRAGSTRSAGRVSPFAAFSLGIDRRSCDWPGRSMKRNRTGSTAARVDAIRWLQSAEAAQCTRTALRAGQDVYGRVPMLDSHKKKTPDMATAKICPERV